MIITLLDATIEGIRLKDDTTITIKTGRLAPETIGDLASLAGSAVEIVFESKQAIFFDADALGLLESEEAEDGEEETPIDD